MTCINNGVTGVTVAIGTYEGHRNNGTHPLVTTVDLQSGFETWDRTDVKVGASVLNSAPGFNTSLSELSALRQQLSSFILIAMEDQLSSLLSPDLSFLLWGQKQTVASLGIAYGSGGEQEDPYLYRQK